MSQAAQFFLREIPTTENTWQILLYTHYHRRTILSRRIPSLYSAQIQRYVNLGDLMRGFPYFAFARTYWNDICCHACQSTKDF